MQKRLVLINVGVVIIGLIAAALLAMPLVRNLYLEEFHRTLDSAVMLLTTDGDEIQEDPEAFVQRKREALQQAGQDIRLTVITLDGQVIGETSKDNPTGINPENENHLAGRRCRRRCKAAWALIQENRKAQEKPTFMRPEYWEIMSCGRRCL